MSDTTYQSIDTSALYGRAQFDRVLTLTFIMTPRSSKPNSNASSTRPGSGLRTRASCPSPAISARPPSGRQPVIVVRDKTGAINVLENRCRHRGATVCEQHKGNAKGFTCPYIAGPTGVDGALRALPYGEGYDGVGTRPNCAHPPCAWACIKGWIIASFDHGIGNRWKDFLGGHKAMDRPVH